MQSTSYFGKAYLKESTWIKEREKKRKLDQSAFKCILRAHVSWCGWPEIPDAEASCRESDPGSWTMCSTDWVGICSFAAGELPVIMDVFNKL